MKKNKEIKKKQEKRLHYNLVAENPSENIFSWYFLIVEDKTEIEKIGQRICENLGTTEHTYIKEGIVGNSHGLRYSFFNLQSSRNKIDFSQVYNGKIIKDRRFYSGESNINLLSILEQEEIITDILRKDKATSKENYDSDYIPFPNYTM